jgi:hypothetical protein
MKKKQTRLSEAEIKRYKKLIHNDAYWAHAISSIGAKLEKEMRKQGAL